MYDTWQYKCKDHRLKIKFITLHKQIFS